MIPRRTVGRGPSDTGGIFFRLVLLLAFLVLVFLTYVIRHPLLRLAGNFWVIDESPHKADVILVLGDDNYRAERAARAAELFKAGWAPRVIASGKFLRPYASIAELEAHDLAERGVPKGAITRFPHTAANTREEAVALAPFLSSHGWKHILLVTSNYHTRRTQYIFEHLLPAGTELTVVAARDSDFDPDNWWDTRLGVKIFFNESVGYLVALWELRRNAVERAGLLSASSGKMGCYPRETFFRHGRLQPDPSVL